MCLFNKHNELASSYATIGTDFYWNTSWQHNCHTVIHSLSFCVFLIIHFVYLLQSNRVNIIMLIPTSFEMYRVLMLNCLMSMVIFWPHETDQVWPAFNEFYLCSSKRIRVVNVSEIHSIKLELIYIIILFVIILKIKFQHEGIK